MSPGVRATVERVFLETVEKKVEAQGAWDRQLVSARILELSE